jgi:hypothetical protein
MHRGMELSATRVDVFPRVFGRRGLPKLCGRSGEISALVLLRHALDTLPYMVFEATMYTLIPMLGYLPQLHDSRILYVTSRPRIFNHHVHPVTTTLCCRGMMCASVHEAPALELFLSFDRCIDVCVELLLRVNDE